MSPFSKKSFDSSKCVSLVEVTQKRLEILKKKRSIVVKQSRDDVAKLLERGQDANAMSRAEHVFREENIVGAYELLEQYCDLVIKGIRAIRSTKECSSELKVAMAGLVYAAPRCGDLQELSKIRELFLSRFGVEYVSSILELQPGCDVNKKIIQKLSSSPPNPDERLKLLKGIASEYKIDWNYQKAVGISFNGGETSAKSKIPTNASLAPKGLTDGSSSSSHVGIKTKEPNVSLSDPSEKPKTKNPSAMSRKSTSSTGENGYANLSENSTIPSNVSDIHPRERGIMGVNSVLPVSSSSTVDNSIDQHKPKDKASLHSRDSSSSAMHKAEHKKKGSISPASASTSEKQNLRSPFVSSVSQDNDSRGHAKSVVKDNVSIAQAFNEGPLPSSSELYGLTKESSASHPSDINRTSQSRPKLSTSNLAHTNVPVPRAELGGAKSGASMASTRHTKLSHKPEHHGISKHGNVIDAHRSTPVEKNLESYRNAHQPAQYLKNSVQSANREEKSSLQKDHTFDQRKGEHRMLKGAEIIEKSLRGIEGPAAYKHVGPKTRHSMPLTELTEAEMDEELADLAITVGSAARAADAALEMVHNTASERSRADKKSLRQGLHSGMHYGSGNAKANLESRKDFYPTVNRQNYMVSDDPEKGQLPCKEPYQEQEPVSFDSEMPCFDDSSDNSSEDPPSKSSSSRLPLVKENEPYKDFKIAPNGNISSSANAFGVQDWNKQFRENVIISKKEDLQTETSFNDYWAQSAGSVSPNSSSSSHQNWGADIFSDMEHGRVSNREIANEDNGMGVLRWHGSSGDGLGKKKWGRDDIRPFSEPHKQHDAVATQTQTGAGKLQGRSVRSVRSS